MEKISRTSRTVVMSWGHLQCPGDPEDPEDMGFREKDLEDIEDIWNVLRTFTMSSGSSGHCKCPQDIPNVLDVL